MVTITLTQSQRGILYDAAGQILYEGEWHDDLPHGVGVYRYSLLTHALTLSRSLTHPCRYSNKDVYEGLLLRGKRMGHGKLVYSNGDKYIGQFKNDFMHGEGTLVTQHCTYTGNIAENKFHGTLLITTPLLTHSRATTNRKRQNNLF